MDTTDIERARENIRRALSLRSKTSFEISLELSRNRTYLDDFLRGRKQSISNAFLQNLANNLDVNRDILSGLQDWSDDPSMLAHKPPPSEELEVAEIEWQTATARVDAILKALPTASGGHLTRAIVELEVARQQQKKLFKNLMSVEKKILIERRDESLERSLENVTVSDFLSHLTTDSANLKLHRVTDNALRKNTEDGIGQGDLVFIDTLNSNFMSGGIFAIEEGGGVYIRRIEYLRNLPNPSIRCRASNPDFQDFDLDLAEVIIIGRVIAHVRPV